MACEDFDSLYQRACGGESAAMGVLLERYAPGLRAYVRLKSGRMLRGRESASDVVQSVCRDVLVDLRDGEARSERQFRNWLFRAAYHKLLGKVDYHRAQRRDVAREVPIRGGDSESADQPQDRDLLDAYGTLCTPSRDLGAREEIARIEAAFDQLPDDLRDVLLQNRFEGRSHRDIAARVGKSEEAVRKLLSRARARLAMLLDRSA